MCVFHYLIHNLILYCTYEDRTNEDEAGPWTIFSHLPASDYNKGQAGLGSGLIFSEVYRGDTTMEPGRDNELLVSGGYDSSG